MNKFYRQKKLSIALLGVTFLCLFVFSTDPSALSPELLLVPPVVLFVILFTLMYALLDAFTHIQKPKKRVMSGVVATMPVILLLLASLGQLTGKDMLLSLLLTSGLAAYFGKARLPVPSE